MSWLIVSCAGPFCELYDIIFGPDIKFAAPPDITQKEYEFDWTYWEIIDAFTGSFIWLLFGWICFLFTFPDDYELQCLNSFDDDDVNNCTPYYWLKWFLIICLRDIILMFIFYGGYHYHTTVITSIGKGRYLYVGTTT